MADIDRNEDAKQRDNRFSDNVGKAMGKAGDAIKTAAKAGAGNIAGAIRDVTTNEKTRNAAIGTILSFVFLLIGVLMLVGVVVVAVILGILSHVADSMEAENLDSAIDSAGSMTYYYTIGSLRTAGAGLFAIIEIPVNLLGEGLAWIGNTIVGWFTTEDEADNSELGGTSIEKSDYDNTLMSVFSLESLVGPESVLRHRLDVIKARVEQRALQIVKDSEELQTEAIAIASAYSLSHQAKDPFLYCGIDAENSSLTIDTESMLLSDIQALKILAAYNVQHSRMLEYQDMWGLVEYCGWYNDFNGGDSNGWDGNEESSWMETTHQFVLLNDLAMHEDVIASEKVVALSTPHVQRWEGSCLPQWAYDEFVQIYEQYRDGHFETNQISEAIALDEKMEVEMADPWGKYTKFMETEPFSIIERIFTTANSTVTISRVLQDDSVYSEEYLLWMKEFLASSSGDSVSAEGEYLTELYENIYSDVSETTPGGNLQTRTKDNVLSFTAKRTIEGSKYYLKCHLTNEETEYLACEQNGQNLTFSNLRPLVAYTLYRVYETDGGPVKPGPQPTPFEPTEKHGKETAIYIADPNGTGSGTSIHIEEVETFTTLPDQTMFKQYKLQVNVHIAFAGRRVDDLIYEVLGLWPGDLNDTEIGEDGKEYARGHVGNELMLKTWTDTYTDENGELVEVEFTRLEGYQDKAFEDYCLGVAAELDIDTTGLLEPDYGYGDTIVDMAEREYEYYHANGLYEGRRYWEIAEKATGGLPPGIGYNSAWCVCFIMCCAYMCGYIGPGQPFGDLGNDWLYWCGGMQRNLMAAGASCHTYGYKPVPGDIVFYDAEVSAHPDWAHVGIVAGVTEDGELLTIEGNYGDVVSKNTFPDYRVGSFAYNGESGERILISAYVHPNYPDTYMSDPLYLKLGGRLNANTSARLITYDDEQILLAGVTRLRNGQLIEFCDALKERYPQLYSDDLHTAIYDGDMDAFILAWNEVSAYGKAEDFKIAQQNLSARLFYRPVIDGVFKDTGFDWSRTAVREEIMLGIVTTSEQTDWLITFLKYISDDLDPNISDQELLAALKHEDFLYAAAYTYRNYLWRDDPEQMQKDWAISIWSLLNLVEKEYAEDLQQPE